MTKVAVAGREGWLGHMRSCAIAVAWASRKCRYFLHLQAGGIDLGDSLDTAIESAVASGPAGSRSGGALSVCVGIVTHERRHAGEDARAARERLVAAGAQAFFVDEEAERLVSADLLLVAGSGGTILRAAEARTAIRNPNSRHQFRARGLPRGGRSFGISASRPGYYRAEVDGRFAADYRRESHLSRWAHDDGLGSQ